MKTLTPSRLVVVRSYGQGANTGARGSASIYGHEDRQMLIDAGIEAYVKSVRGFGTALVVPESTADEARRMLDASPNLFPDATAPSCPKCRAPHPVARPPYGLGIIAVGFAIGATAMVMQHAGVAFAALAAGVVGAAILEQQVAPWRCTSCGYHYGRPQDDPHRVIRMPPRP